MDKRILKNTIILYCRTFVTMLIALYTSRVVLDVLGVEDYGIYNLVAGIVLIFSSLSTTVSAVTQRYISYSIGEGGTEHIRMVFSTSCIIHLLMALFVLFLGETIGLWFINNGINIPSNRLQAANIAYQGALVVFAINIINLVLGSLIIAYERMSAYAYIYIMQAVLRLINVFVLQWVGVDKLILYTILELLVSIVVFVGFCWYCKHSFEVFGLVRAKSKTLFVEMEKFAGWNFMGATANVLYEQGANILLNRFFSLVLNAARGITLQVSVAVNTFVSNFSIALNPQITKSYASGEIEKTRKLVMAGCKLSFYMTLFAAFPIMLNTSFLLSVWLKHVPEYAVIFVGFAVFCAILDSFTRPLHCALFASGRIRNYQVAISTISLIRVPLLMLCFYLGYSPEWIYYFVMVFIICHHLLLVSILVRRKILFPTNYLRVVIFPSFSVLAICLIIFFLFEGHKCNLVRFIAETFLSLVGVTILTYVLGVTNAEREKIKLFLLKKTEVIRHKW